jgi:hypothetical protein
MAISTGLDDGGVTLVPVTFGLCLLGILAVTLISIDELNACDWDAAPYTVVVALIVAIMGRRLATIMTINENHFCLHVQ